ncbi:MAG: hypothetical protein ACRCT8_08100 [Lacipirellulaceae bacterium]
MFANFDAVQYRTNGFAFGDFNDFDALDATGSVIRLDIANDVDPGNGLFGGMGSDITSPDFSAATTQIVVNLTIDPLNTAPGFNVVLVDNDGPGAGEEYQYYFDLQFAAVGTPITLTQSLVSPGPVFRQTAFNQLPGDEVQNYGLRQVQVQSLFGGTNRLKIDIGSVKVEDPGNPLLFEYTSSQYNAQVARFTFGSFQQPGAFDTSGSTILINADPAAAGGPGGGAGFSGLNVDFNAAEYQIEVLAKLSPGNAASTFNVVLGDRDGNDSGPGLGSEDFYFAVPTSAFDSTGFSTFTIPLGSGSQSQIVRSFGLNNDGDGLQNFGMFQMQIQANDTDTGRLALEVQSFRLVARPPAGDGDYNGDGVVNAADYTVWRDALGTSVALPGDTTPGTVTQADYNVWSLNYGTGASTATAIPEPTSLAMVCCVAVALGAGRRVAA